MIKKKIVAISKTGGLTRRGHYRNYWIVLECGHIILTSFSVSIRIDEFMLLQGLEQKKRCRKCEQGKPVDVEMLKQFTPYKVWNKQNFDRFEQPKP